MKIRNKNARCSNKSFSLMFMPPQSCTMAVCAKRILLLVFIILSVSLVIAPAALAAGVDGNYVIDETGILTASQIDALNRKAAAISEERECAVYVWIVDLVPEQDARNMDTMERYADAFYAKNGFGYGAGRNGMVLLLEIGDVPGERDYCLNTHGACTSIFTSSVKENMLDEEIVPLFKAAFGNGNFYKVADVFYDQVELKFAAGIRNSLLIRLAVVILLPLLIALIVCSLWKRQMKTAKLARTADNYIPANGFNLTGRSDQFLYRTTTRVKIERSSPSGGGSSSSSSGRSSGGKV